jgi:hypothetical protein
MTNWSVVTAGPFTHRKNGARHTAPQKQNSIAGANSANVGAGRSRRGSSSGICFIPREDCSA